MDKKLGKLDAIEKQISSLSRKVSSMDSRLLSLEKSQIESKQKIDQLENSSLFVSQGVDDIHSKQSKLNDEIKADRDKSTSLSKEYEKLKTVKEDILDLQARSMRDNLLFMGFPECDSFEDRKNENCVKMVHDFCRDRLKISDAHDSVKIERAHRLGRYTRNKSRPIIVKFNHFPDKMLIKSRAFEELKGTSFRVAEEYPKVIQDRRKVLGETMKRAREAGRTASLSYD